MVRAEIHQSGDTTPQLDERRVVEGKPALYLERALIADDETFQNSSRIASEKQLSRRDWR